MSTEIELIGRQTIEGLILEICELIGFQNDNNVTAWSQAELKAMEITRVAQTVQDGILRRGAAQPLPFDEEL